MMIFHSYVSLPEGNQYCGWSSEILHQLMVNIPGFSLGFNMFQPSWIGGAGFRWPIHSMTWQVPLFEILDPSDPSGDLFCETSPFQ